MRNWGQVRTAYGVHGLTFLLDAYGVLYSSYGTAGRSGSMQVAVTITPSHTSFPSARCMHGRVKLFTLICIQRLGTLKLVTRLGATHPTTKTPDVRIKAMTDIRKLKEVLKEPCCMSFTLSS